ncbi:hypothetical protein A966_04391 [Brachyspira hampsonii 30446]|uniref:Uncharacterized protein n=2 Tax=Brachyspira hampsonii TaxID=1287055 RepID=A0A2U4EWW9_9SPIR|nr:hypothetical protein [Brachyspira hampsonii]EKV57598.1 hypothetical protein A966_04391 [Brachyspira hampsonii 30446]
MIILLLALIIIGNINRIGYLNNISLIEDNTYSFRISYYDKVFRNSDIYGVYLDIEKTINDYDFIKDIKMGKYGSPYGDLITDKAIDIEKIYNIKYTLKIKSIIYFYAFIIYILIVIFLYFFKEIKNVINIPMLINFLIINKKTSVPILSILFIFIILLLSIIVLGNIPRTGYLDNISLIADNTYRFRINYYDKVFRNSDIYDVYLDIQKTINDNNFIKDIRIDKKGSPFGTLITDKAIETEKIDNIKYYLKIKNIVYLYALIIYLFSIFLFYCISIVKENKLILVSASLLIIIQIFIYFSLYNYFRLI